MEEPLAPSALAAVGVDRGVIAKLIAGKTAPNPLEESPLKEVSPVVEMSPLEEVSPLEEASP